MTNQATKLTESYSRQLQEFPPDQPILAYKKYVAKLGEALERISDQELITFVDLMRRTQASQSTVFIIGNGGSASAAAHWATDLGRGLYHHRQELGIKALSLSDNIAWISAAANDVGYESVFSDQLRAHGRKGDLLISISASGNSPNIIQAVQRAKEMGVISLSIIGFDGGKAKDLSDHIVHIPTVTGDYGLTEDIQLILNHFLCDYLVGGIH